MGQIKLEYLEIGDYPHSSEDFKNWTNMVVRHAVETIENFDVYAPMLWIFNKGYVVVAMNFPNENIVERFLSFEEIVSQLDSYEGFIYASEGTELMMPENSGFVLDALLDKPGIHLEEARRVIMVRMIGFGVDKFAAVPFSKTKTGYQWYTPEWHEPSTLISDDISPLREKLVVS